MVSMGKVIKYKGHFEKFEWFGFEMWELQTEFFGSE